MTVLDAVIVADGSSTALVDDCYEQHARFVDTYWQVSSTDAVAYAERRADALRPLLQECLTRRGVDWPEDASFEELGSLGFDPERAGPSGTASSGAPENCLDEIGYAEWEG